MLQPPAPAPVPCSIRATRSHSARSSWTRRPISERHVSPPLPCDIPGRACFSGPAGLFGAVTGRSSATTVGCACSFSARSSDDATLLRDDVTDDVTPRRHDVSAMVLNLNCGFRRRLGSDGFAELNGTASASETSNRMLRVKPLFGAQREEAAAHTVAVGPSVKKPLPAAGWAGPLTPHTTTHGHKMATYDGSRNASGEREGQGTLHFTSGATYVGEWRKNVREGAGTMSYAGGEVYEGEWRDNQREGQGTHWYADGSSYAGEWSDDKRDGQGLYSFTNGAVYEGEYRKGQREGKGAFRYPNGVSQIARYERGEPVREGARWSVDHDGLPSTAADRRVAWRLRDGKAVEGITLEQAAAIASRAGLPVPPVGFADQAAPEALSDALPEAVPAA